MQCSYSIENFMDFVHLNFCENVVLTLLENVRTMYMLHFNQVCAVDVALNFASSVCMCNYALVAY